MKKNKVLAWHFLPENGMTRYNHITVIPGVEIVHKGKIKLCASGLHASIKLDDALSFAPGPILCRVLSSGRIEKGDDKIVSTRRTVLWMFDASRVLRLWGCWCVRNTKLADGRTTWDLLTDIRSRNAVEVAERFAVGGATREELAAACDAACDAARGAARGAARTAACDAAGDAAGGAAWDAAGDAARDAARTAACDAARGAAWDAAGSAAWGAAWDAAAKQLEIMVIAEAKRLGVYLEDPE